VVVIGPARSAGDVVHHVPAAHVGIAHARCHQEPDGLDNFARDDHYRCGIPREWFLVPLFVINEAVEKVRDGSITGYVYDPKAAALARVVRIDPQPGNSWTQQSPIGGPIASGLLAPEQ
jgi:hypothetical protein